MYLLLFLVTCMHPNLKAQIVHSHDTHSQPREHHGQYDQYDCYRVHGSLQNAMKARIGSANNGGGP